MKKKSRFGFFGLLSIKPAQLMALSFLGAIGIGTMLLCLPQATATGEPLSVIDALFTATSATCVTGLIVRDTGSYFSLFGQLVILGLIQIGGLGIMTFSVTLGLALRRGMGKRHQFVMRDILDYDSASGIAELVKFILKMTIFFEVLGGALLFFNWSFTTGYNLTTLYQAFFHAISGFCNAGFSLFSNSLQGFRADLATNVIMSALIITGGLGFIVISDFYRHRRIKSQTKMVLLVTLILLAAGTLFIYLAESNNALAGLPLGEKIMASFFQSVTARTAGFNTIPTANLARGSLFFIVILMFIGASSGGTGGGIKTNTFGIIVKAVMSAIRNRPQVEIYKRTVPRAVVRKAIAILLIGIFILSGFFISLLFTQDSADFEGLLFEAASAFGTVGLSTGITGTLNEISKFLIIALMFIGRLGPLTIALALTRRRPEANYEYAEERIMVG